jgi:hypothetical protein
MSGVYTSETAIEARMLRPSASERLWKNCPTTPRSSTSGRNTTTVVSDEPTIAPSTSRVPPATASNSARRGASGASACARRATFSTTTMASSMIRPIATARPPRLMRLSDSPTSGKVASVSSTESGMASPATSVTRQFPRNSAMTRIDSAAPTAMASATPSMESFTRPAWS